MWFLFVSPLGKISKENASNNRSNFSDVVDLVSRRRADVRSISNREDSHVQVSRRERAAADNAISICLLRIRYFDVVILIPNLIFLLFVLLKWLRTKTKLNTNKPLLFSVTCLIVAVALSNVCRCLFAIVFPEQAYYAQEIILKVRHRSPRNSFDASADSLASRSVHAAVHRTERPAVRHLFW